MPSKKPSSLVQAARKKKFFGKLTKWEKRRIIRRLSRQATAKRPLIEPLTIAVAEERNSAFKKNKMVFYDGKERLEIPIRTPGHMDSLLGVYKLCEPGKPKLFFSLRLIDDCQDNPRIRIMQLENKNGSLSERIYAGFAVPWDDLAHMQIREEFRGVHLPLTAVSKAERHARAINSGSHFQAFQLWHEGFKEVIEKLGYKILEKSPKELSKIVILIGKTGKHHPKDNLSKFIRIEAIDPKNGKARLFTFALETPFKAI